MKKRPLKQKTIGLLGGSSNIATIEYYRLLNEAANRHFGGWDIAETLIAGMNFGNIEAFIRAGDWEVLESYIEGKVDNLLAGGADFLLCVSNTLHKPLVKILSARRSPFIHIADPTGSAIRTAGLKRVALFGTRPVMELDYLKRYYEDKFGLDLIVPDENERLDIDRIIFDELTKNILTAGSKQRYLNIADRLARDERAEGLILGCTEIFLLIEQADRPDFPMFNTTRLHCEAAIAFALQPV
jgi:aspartate racemase